MADPVSSLGSSSAGTLQPFQAVSKSPPAAEKASPAKADFLPKGPEERPVGMSAQELDGAAKAIQEYLQNAQLDLKFSVDQDTGSVVFKIVNAVTHEVIRQVPSEEVLLIAGKMKKLSTTRDTSGVLVDKQG